MTTQDLLTQAGNARLAIMELYNNNLYEDNWDQSVMQEFDKQLNIYGKAVEQLQTIIPNLKWTDTEKKKKFLQKYNELLLADYESFKLTKIRHEAYPVYRSNRKSLIKQINKVAGFVKSKGTKDYKEVFYYFNDICAKIPLYKKGHRENDGRHFYKIPELINWFNVDTKDKVETLNDDPRTSEFFDATECKKVFDAYVKCRQIAFAIFNMITSANDINGYDKWHNILDKYCENQLNDKEMEKLYDAVNSEKEFIFNTSKYSSNEISSQDYHQTMDDYSWNQIGIYESLNESWFMDSLKAYNDNVRDMHKKESIKNIRMKNHASNVCKISTDGKSVYSAVKFYPDDIIEICPTKTIDRHSLYAKDMRDIVFEVIKGQEWVLPFGYCQYYDLSDHNNEANCTFVWDPVQKVIVIKALTTIPKFTKLFLNNVN